MGGGSPANVSSSDLFVVGTVGWFLTFMLVSGLLAAARTPTRTVVLLLKRKNPLLMLGCHMSKKDLCQLLCKPVCGFGVAQGSE